MSARVRVSSGFWGQLNLLWSFIGLHIAITQVDMHTQRVGGWVMDTFSYNGGFVEFVVVAAGCRGYVLNFLKIRLTELSSYKV